MRPIMLALALSLPCSALHADTLLERYPSLVTKAWYQLCGGKRSLPFDPRFGCCCFTQSTGRYCVRPSGGFLPNCVYVCDTARCM
jgi:hypothetical protein